MIRPLFGVFSCTGIDYNNYRRENNLQIYHRTSSKASFKESTEEELRRLRKENRLLKQERDILKKATAYFAKETL